MELINKELYIYTVANSISYLFIVSMSVLAGFTSASLTLISSYLLLKVAVFLELNNQVWFFLLDGFSSAGSLGLFLLFQLQGISFMYFEAVKKFKKYG
ncbi:hypothetical protein MmiHf6_05450 [Methanimicrococcus hongohii]|uniref:Uncharacterized protein n=1 Tax=Methanimicrococcus hongohii TaxID=3028295 RepID=A0AA96ZSA8_9EURY|nr:hypothetical protein [Methanimicrococcus sp. Hf6]WNY23240.1 hypothetical protein MmiHf6_05450 [Methanimicrococcus sp. Hf6]